MKKGTTKEQRKELLLEGLTCNPPKGGGAQDFLAKWMGEEFDISYGTVVNYLEEMMLDKQIELMHVNSRGVPCYRAVPLNHPSITWADLQGIDYRSPRDYHRRHTQAPPKPKRLTLDDIFEMLKAEVEHKLSMRRLKAEVQHFIDGNATVADLRKALEESE